MTETKPHATQEGAPELFPVLPLRDIVVFPYMIVPLFVGREKSIAALEEVMRDDKQILLVAQKNASEDEPSTDDIYDIGTLASVLQLLKLPDGTVKVLVEGTVRAAIGRYIDNENYFEAELPASRRRSAPRKRSRRWPARSCPSSKAMSSSTRRCRPRSWSRSSQIEDQSKLADTIASHLAIKIAEKQQLLELTTVVGAAGARVHAHGERDLRAAGREEDPLAASSVRWRRRSASTT